MQKVVDGNIHKTCVRAVQKALDEPDEKPAPTKPFKTGQDLQQKCMHEWIFERFYHVDADRSRGSGGTGFGLPIVRSNMQMHDGTVVATSGADGRTTFQLRFPLI